MSDQPVRYLTLDDWTHLCAEVLDVELATITFTADLHLADSALHAPQASFGEDDAYPDLVDKAAVLGWHLVKNHPLLKGLNVPKTGQSGSVGVLVTKTLVIAGDPQVTTRDGQRGAYLRAYDKKTGAQVGEGWRHVDVRR